MEPSPISQSPEFCLGLLEAAPDAIVVVDERGRIVLVNEETERIFGYSRDELLGETIECLIPERLRATHAEERDRYEAAPHRRAMDSGLELIGRRKDGSEFPVEVGLSPLALPDRRVVIGIVRDITERKRSEANLWFLSTHDSLTGLYNRSYFDDRMEHLERGRRHPVSILVADVDGLKEVNDALGHAAGDDLLVRTGKALTRSLRVEDVVARMGGDEFAALLPATSEAQVKQLAERLRAVRDAPQEGLSALRFSVGVATGREGQRLAEVLRLADAHMYEEKLAREHRVR